MAVCRCLPAPHDPDPRTDAPDRATELGAAESSAKRGWLTGLHDRSVHRGGHRRGPSGASSRFVSCGGGGRRGSATCWGCIPRRCTGCWPVTDSRAWPGSTEPRDASCVAMNAIGPASWCTWTSRSSAISETAVGGGCSVAPSAITTPAPTLLPARADTGTRSSATTTCTPRPMTTPAWPTPNCCPTRPRQRLGEYAATWIDERPNLRGKTQDLYRWWLSKHLDPTLGSMRLIDVTPAKVRTWRAGRLSAGVSASTSAKACRLLRAVLNTAVADGVLPSNPCQIPGARL